MGRKVFSMLQLWSSTVPLFGAGLMRDHKNVAWLKSNDASSKLWSLASLVIAIKSRTHAPWSEVGVQDAVWRGGGEHPRILFGFNSFLHINS
jgi:hypothetical protein